jgi:hypothetical protein
MQLMRASVLAAILPLGAAIPGFAGPHGQRGTPSPPPASAAGPQVPSDQPITPRKIQELFDAYIVLQAKDRLQLADAQYGQFVTRLNALQQTRRRHLVAHQQILNDLRKLTNPQTGSNDEATITERLKALHQEDESAAADLRKAYDGVDETLDLRQQARFRIFEDQMEQQKLELLMRARQDARAAARGKKGGGL